MWHVHSIHLSKLNKLTSDLSESNFKAHFFTVFWTIQLLSSKQPPPLLHTYLASHINPIYFVLYQQLWNRTTQNEISEHPCPYLQNKTNNKTKAQSQMNCAVIPVHLSEMPLPFQDYFQNIVNYLVAVSSLFYGSYNTISGSNHTS